MHLFFSQPTSPVARGHVSAIWDPGNPYPSPQTTIFTPETSPFSSQCCLLSHWIMAPNPPNHLFACTEYIPSCKVNHSRQEEKLLISHFLMCPHHVQTMTLSLKFLFYESFFNHSPNTIHVISFLNRHFLSTALCKFIS